MASSDEDYFFFFFVDLATNQWWLCLAIRDKFFLEMCIDPLVPWDHNNHLFLNTIHQTSAYFSNVWGRMQWVHLELAWLSFSLEMNTDHHWPFSDDIWLCNEASGKCGGLRWRPFLSFIADPFETVTALPGILAVVQTWGIILGNGELRAFCSLITLRRGRLVRQDAYL